MGDCYRAVLRQYQLEFTCPKSCEYLSGGSRCLIASRYAELKLSCEQVIPAGNGGQGPSAFGGALLSFQPFMKLFTVGLEADALAFRRNVGFAVLPSLRCSF